MKIIRAKDYNDMSRKAANSISAQVILKPESVLGLATGSSPIGIYEQLIKWYHKGDVDFGACTTFNLDEYRGLTPDHDQSYHYFMHKNFFDAVNIPDERINLPDGAATRIHVSGGIAWYPEDGTEMMDLIKCADYAMYRIKKSEKGRFGVFDRAQYEQAQKEMKRQNTQEDW